MKVRLLIYLIMSLCYMFVGMAGAKTIQDEPENKSALIFAITALILTIMLLAVMFGDIGSILLNRCALT